MKSSKLTSIAHRSLVLLSGALLLLAGGALSTAHADDAQTQASRLLAPTIGDRPAVSRMQLQDNGGRPVSVNPQEQARRALLGRPSGKDAGVAAARYATSTTPLGIAGRDPRRAWSDAQDMARRIILGTAI